MAIGIVIVMALVVGGCGIIPGDISPKPVEIKRYNDSATLVQAICKITEAHRPTDKLREKEKASEDRWAIAHQVLMLLHLDNDVVCDHLASLDTKDFLRSITYYLKTTEEQEKRQIAKNTTFAKSTTLTIPLTAAEPPSWIDTLNDRYDLYGSSYIGAIYSIGWFRPIAQRVLGDCDLLDIDGYGNNCMEDVSTTGARIVNAEIAVALSHESPTKKIELLQRIDRWCWTKIMFTAPYRFQAAGEENDSCRLPLLETVLVKINSTHQMVAYMLNYLPCEIILDRIQLNYKIPTRFERMSKSKNMRFLYQYYEALQTTKDPWYN